MRKKYLGIALAAGMILTLQFSQVVYAGDINAAEQELINYCSGVFYYEGKAYKATSEAIQKAYAKLSADGVDLTSQKAEAAKRQVAKNIKKGIDSGCFVEVSVDDSKKEEADQNTEGPDQEKEETEREDKDIVQQKQPVKEETDQQEENVEQNKKNKAAVEKSSEEKKKPLVSKTGEKIEKLFPTKTKEPETTSPLIRINKTEKSGQILYYTIEDYQSGISITTTKDGEVLFKREIPIKNTGYSTRRILKLGMVLTVFLVVFLSTSIWWIRRQED